MAATANQKLKTLYLKQLLETETDAEHGVTMERILGYLSSHGIDAERKSIYTDLDHLRAFGMDIGVRRGKQTEYMLLNPKFELPELKLLVDSVAASRFITHKKSLSLIKKLERETSVHEARELSRQVFVSRRIKTMNESIYYSVDTIHSAINADRQIKFKYFEYAPDKQRVMRRSGADYEVSPLSLIYSDENYYLAAFSENRGAIANFRVDRMLDVRVAKAARIKNDETKSFDAPSYVNRSFSMYGGERERVDILFHNSLSTVVIDRFGKDVIMRPADSEHFAVTVDVDVSPVFLSWVFMFGSRAWIMGPKNVVEQMATMAREVADSYPEEFL